MAPGYILAAAKCPFESTCRREFIWNRSGWTGFGFMGTTFYNVMFALL